MKQTKLPGEQSQAYNILSLIAISGELPTDQISRLPSGNAYKRKLIKSLKSKKLIHTYYGDKLRTLRLTTGAKELLLAAHEERFSFFMSGNSETNILKSEINRRLRLKRIAETIITMKNAGVLIYRDEKPDIFSNEHSSALHFTEVMHPVFYNSREVKGLGPESDTIQGARFVGVLLTPATIFVVYNTGDSLLKWHNNSEMRVKAMMTTAIHYNRMFHQYSHDSVRALMLGSDMEQMYKLLTIRERGRRKYFALDGNYESFIYLTNDRNGEMVLRLLCDSEKRSELNHILSEDLYSHNPASIVENDAIDENGEPMLFAYDCDMPRITRFNSALTIHNRKGTLICFDFQKDVLRRFCADNVSIQSIDIKKFEARFFS